jgi:hypothetical protein
MLDSRFLFSRVTLVAVMLLGLVGAAVLGILVGETDIHRLLLIACAALVFVYATSLYRYVWQISLFLIYTGFGYAPSFKFGPLELTCALGTAVIALFIWQKRSVKKPEVLNQRAFRFMRGAIFLWLLYIGLHFFYNYRDPFRPAEFSLSNAAKSYFAGFVPFLMLHYFSGNPLGLRITPRFFRTIGILCLVGIGFNLFLRLSQLHFGGFTVVIAFLNAHPDDNILRTSGPMAMLFGAVGLTSRSPRKVIGPRLLWWTLLWLGAIGSVFSGGRASVVLGAMFVLVVFVCRRRSILLIATLFVAGGAVGFANLFSGWINSDVVDPFLQRSLQWILVEKTVAAEDIASSSAWRKELRHKALVEWQSNPREFWLGRATYGFGVQDDVALLISGGYEAIMESSLRRGATHNLVTDLLVAYGLIGCALYAAAYWSITWFLWRLCRSRELSPQALDLVLVAFVGMAVFLAYDTIGGSTIRIELVWLAIVGIASLYFGPGLRPTPDQAVRPAPEAPQLALHANSGRATFRKHARIVQD